MRGGWKRDPLGSIRCNAEGMIFAALLVASSLPFAGSLAAPGCCPPPYPPPPQQPEGRFCCRSPNCSTCPTLYPSSVPAVPPSDVKIVLTPLASEAMCATGGGSSLQAGGVLCIRNCGGATSDHAYVLHQVESSTVGNVQSTCADCCILSYDTLQVCARSPCEKPMPLISAPTSRPVAPP